MKCQIPPKSDSIEFGPESTYDAFLLGKVVANLEHKSVPYQAVRETATGGLHHLIVVKVRYDNLISVMAEGLKQ